MTQQFKAIYFTDFPSELSTQKSLTLAFGKKDGGLFESIQPLTSHEIRDLLGYQNYIDLERDAKSEGLSLNTFCLRQLRQNFDSKPLNSNQPLLPGFFDSGGINIDPVQATFRGGENEPLHLWYPYLEGYSPAFVEAIISQFPQNSQQILDPFSGAGTTPLTIARLGKQAYYCEINPLLQYLTDVKLMVYSLDNTQKEGVRNKVEWLIDNWENLLLHANPNRNLDRAFPKVFGKSKFFDKETYELVLRSRTLLDNILISDETLGKLLAVAILASLLPSSNLIRSGDIRYRKGKEIDRKVPFSSGVELQLQLMANDIPKIPKQPKHSPKFLCEDARKLGYLPKLRIDSIITSPPYLNGTNYFRNTKIELWFLQCLKSKQDLSDFRYKAVTAGINNVTVEKISQHVPPPVNDLVKKLEESAYDSRIPRMILSYFQDMESIFSNTRKHLTDGAKVAIDLGDSIYGGVHVQTDRILVEILESIGYVLEDRISLRKRLSRNRMELQQVLLIFHYRTKGKDGKLQLTYPKIDKYWQTDWKQFQSNLPHQQHPYSKRNWGSGLHSLCSYQGKMKPSLANHLVKTFLPSGGRMLDPFAGVGTIPFEASQMGMKAFGFEISPAALTISAAKTGDIKDEECNKLIDNLEEYLDIETPTSSEYSLAKKITFNGDLSDYFHPQTYDEVLIARRYFQVNSPTSSSENLVLASLLHILHGNRPYALSRRSHPITPYKPTGPVEYRPLIPRLREKVKRSLSVCKPETFVAGKMYFQDATKWWPQEVDKLDAIITSPPFFDSTRFHMGNWMRLWFCGWEREEFETKPLDFIDERQKKSFSIYESIFRQSKERLKPNGVLVMHLGLSHKSNMAEELASIAKTWFKVEDIFVEDVSHLESHGIRDKGTVKGHQYLVLT